jgi:transposase-like protein
MRIQDLVKEGLVCPSCRSKKIRAGYHDWHNMDSFICEKCGLRWQEDTNDLESFVRYVLQRKSKKEIKQRFIWVLHLANHTSEPLKNPDSADETSYENFVKWKSASNHKQETEANKE